MPLVQCRNFALYGTAIGSVPQAGVIGDVDRGQTNDHHHEDEQERSRR
jgi:hypothetical protein